MAHWQSTVLRAAAATRNSESDRRSTGLLRLRSAVVDYAASACITGVNWLCDENKSCFITQNIPIFGAGAYGAADAVFRDTDLSNKIISFRMPNEHGYNKITDTSLTRTTKTHTFQYNK